MNVSICVSRPVLKNTTAVLLCVLTCAVFLALPLAVAPDSYENALLLGIASLLGLGALFVISQMPVNSIAMLIASGILMPPVIDRLSGPRLSIPFLLTPALLAFWLFRRTNADQADRGGSDARRPLLFWLAACVLSFLAGQFRWFPAPHAPVVAQVGGLAVMLMSGGVLLMMADTLPDVRALKTIVGAFFAVAGLRIALSIAPMDVLLPENVQKAVLPNSPLGSMFWTWLMALAFSQVVCNRGIKAIPRSALLLLLSGAVYLTFIKGRDWASGWAPGFVACYVILLVARPKLAFLLTLAAAVILVLNYSKVMASLFNQDQQYSLNTRVAAMEVLSKIAKTNPLLGFGPSNYYHYTPLFAIKGWYVRFSSHNTYIDIILQTGILGLSLLAWFVWRVVRIALGLRNKVGTDFVNGYVVGVIGGLAGTLVAAALGDWVVPFIYNVGIAGFRSSILAWIFLGGLIAVERLVTAQAAILPRHEALPVIE